MSYSVADSKVRADTRTVEDHRKKTYKLEVDLPLVIGGDCICGV